MAESQATRVRQYVQALERDDRYIVLLYYADGLTPMEISRVLDLPSTRVRSRLEAFRGELANLTGQRPAATAFGHEQLGDSPAAYA